MRFYKKELARITEQYLAGRITDTELYVLLESLRTLRRAATEYAAAKSGTTAFRPIPRDIRRIS